MIVISYRSRELAHSCTKLDMAQHWLGPTNAQALIDLIADAEALENAQALIDFHNAKVLEDNSLSIALSPKCEVVLMPIGPEIRQARHGAPVWKNIRRLMLIEVKEG